MKILELDIPSMEKLRLYTEPNKEKINKEKIGFDLLGNDFRESVISSCNKIDALVVMDIATSIKLLEGKYYDYFTGVLLEIKQGKYYDYFTGAEVLFKDNQITRICLIVNYTNKDIEDKNFLPLPVSDLINSASEYVDRLINCCEY